MKLTTLTIPLMSAAPSTSGDVKCKFCGTPINSATSLETNDGWVCDNCADSEYWDNEDFVGFCEGCGKALYKGDAIYEGNEATENHTDFYCESCWEKLNR